MKILFTGATGVLGRAAVPYLVSLGHDVSGVARTDHDAGWLDGVGARPLNVDLFDPSSVTKSMSGIDTVVHYATAIPRQAQMPRREAWDLNDRLRDNATGILVDAALAHGVTRFVQQSVSFVYRDTPTDWLDENSPIDPTWDVLDSALAAETHVDRFRSGGGIGVVLRLSRLYGPGNASDELISSVSQRKVPVLGSGRNYISSLHVEDATSALGAALEVPGGTYNVTDDEPITSKEYFDGLAELLRAPAPRRIPRFAARLALGKATGLLTVSQRVSNQLFRSSTGWQPRYRSVLDGFATIVAERE